MKRLSHLLVSVILLPAYSRAQPTQTLTYPDGKKRLEGACTFTLNPYFNTNLLSELFLNEGRRRRDDDGADKRVMDADYPISSTERREQFSHLAGLSMICDGPVTMYYRSGAKQAELAFKSGQLTGTAVAYYPEGGAAYRGALEAGTPQGVHTRYYKDGGVYSIGRYLPFTQAELLEDWQFFSSGGDPEDREKTEKEFTEEGLRSGDGEEAMATSWQRTAFRRFTDGLLQTGRKEDLFTFFRRGGKKWAEVHYAADVRTGTWTIWNERGKPTLKLEYSPAGRLDAVTDSNGKRQTLDALTKSWREAVAARNRTLPATGDPNGIDPGIIVEAPPPPVSGMQRPPEVFTFVEQMPEYPGNIHAYIADNLRYPAKAKKESIEGRVVVQFVVREDGRITDAKILRGIGGGCDEEALRLVRAMPKWKPGKQNGKAVAVRFSLPIQFKLR